MVHKLPVLTKMWDMIENESLYYHSLTLQMHLFMYVPA